MSYNLQSGFQSVPMGIVQNPASVPPTPGDTLPFSPQGLIPVSTGTGWQTVPLSSVSALGTLATGTTTINCGLYNYFTLTCYGGAMTFAFANIQVGQTIEMFITGAGSAAITWPGTFSWIGLTATPAASSSAPVVTAATVLVAITCTSVGNYVGSYITS